MAAAVGRNNPVEILSLVSAPAADAENWFPRLHSTARLATLSIVKRRAEADRES